MPSSAPEGSITASNGPPASGFERAARDGERPGRLEVRSIDYVPLAERHGKAWHLGPLWFMANAEIVTRAVGLIVDPHQAETIVADGQADFVALARALLADPRWPWRAAAALGEEVRPIPQYARSAQTMVEWAAPPDVAKQAA